VSKFCLNTVWSSGNAISEKLQRASRASSKTWRTWAGPEGGSQLLRHAIEHEYEAMFRSLVERGCVSRDQDTVAECVKVAVEKGLESISQLVRWVHDMWKLLIRTECSDDVEIHVH
jgi:hypothetical protein